jgi:hypothetical protein
MVEVEFEAKTRRSGGAVVITLPQRLFKFQPLMRVQVKIKEVDNNVNDRPSEQVSEGYSDSQGNQT